MSKQEGDSVRLVIRRVADDTEVSTVPVNGSDPNVVAQLVANIRASLLPGYYLDYPEKAAGKRAASATGIAN